MIVNDEKLLSCLKIAINDCKGCLEEFVKVFGWYTHYGQRVINFVEFFKDYGIWIEEVHQIHFYVDQDSSTEDQLKIYQDAYNEGLTLFDRANNALSQWEIVDAFQDGGAAFYQRLGKFEVEVTTISKMVKILNQGKLDAKKHDPSDKLNSSESEKEGY